jgi:hypothetical protein
MGFGDATLTTQQRQILVLVHTRKATTLRTVADGISRDRPRTQRTCESLNPLYLVLADDGTITLTREGVAMAKMICECVTDAHIARIVKERRHA